MKKIIISRFLMVILCAVLALAQSFAQERTLSGTVTDAESGEPMPGASVTVKGTTRGVITDLDGNFQIGVTEGETVTVSFVGYMLQEFPITDQTSLQVALIADVSELDEVIVIGYGLQKKEDKTGAVASIDADELNSGALTDPLMSMTGRAAGVVVTKGGGDPNSDAKIKIRGSSGLGTDTNPLYVIDGVPGADPNMVAPENIESVSILKDAASTAIYGSQGANGVVLISTKSGSEGSTMLSVSSTTSIERIAKKIDLLSASDYRTLADFYHEGWTDGGASTDWQDEIFRTGISQNTNVSASGGTEKGNYYASVTHSNWEGIIKTSSKQRTIANLKTNHFALDGKLKVSSNISTAFEKNNLVDYGNAGSEDVLYQAYRRNPTDPVKNEDGTFAFERITDNRGFNYINPVGILENVDRYDTRKKILASVGADWEIIDDLRLVSTASYLSKDKEYKYFRPVGVYGSQGADNGAASRFYEVQTQKTLETTLNYIKSFGKHNLTLLAGHSWQEFQHTNFGANVSDAQSPSIGVDKLQGFLRVQYGDVQSDANMSRLIGFFGRATYNYNSKYYLSGSIRRDGSSKFGENNEWGIFPTASIGWNMHHESFLKNLTFVSQLKLRASYGVSGNQAFGSYLSKEIAYPGQIIEDPVSGNDVLVWQAGRNANPDLKWEETTEVNAGIDFGFLQNRVSGTFEVYNKTTNNLLYEYSVPSPPYRFTRLWSNSATVISQGWELFVMTNVVDINNFNWKTNVSVSQNKGRVEDLGDLWAPESDGRQGYLSGDGLVGGDNWTIFIEEDEPIGNLYLYEFAYVEDGRIYYKNNFQDDEDDTEPFVRENELSNNDRVIKGNTTPDIEIGWGNNITFLNNIHLDFNFRGLFGHQIYNHTKGFFSAPSNLPQLNVHKDATEYIIQDVTGKFSKPTDIFMEDGDFVRLEYLGLGYNLNFEESKTISKLRFTLSANNLFVITNYTGADPEITIDGLAYGVDNFNLYPKARSFSLTVNATF
jgi:TonB-linked SusC/RagA family outer membrane protein